MCERPGETLRATDRRQVSRAPCGPCQDQRGWRAPGQRSIPAMEENGGAVDSRPEIGLVRNSFWRSNAHDPFIPSMAKKLRLTSSFGRRHNFRLVLAFTLLGAPIAA